MAALCPSSSKDDLGRPPWTLPEAFGNLSPIWIVRRKRNRDTGATRVREERGERPLDDSATL
jgi:hypothetical protein